MSASEAAIAGRRIAEERRGRRPEGLTDEEWEARLDDVRPGREVVRPWSTDAVSRREGIATGAVVPRTK